MKQIASALIATTLTAGACQAALITVDLRVEETQGKTASITSAGQSIVLGLYLIVANNNNNRADDGFTNVRGGMLSVDAGLLGDFSSLTPGPAMDAGLSSGGAPENLDANPDLELGGKVANNNSGFIYVTSGVSELRGTGTGSSSTEFKLGTLSWTALNATGVTSLNFFAQPRTTLTASNPVVWARSDGTDYKLRYDDTNLGIGSAVVISVPEPALAGVVGAFACLLLRRRARRRIGGLQGAAE